jgi:hypothetical protein
MIRRSSSRFVFPASLLSLTHLMMHRLTSQRCLRTYLLDRRIITSVMTRLFTSARLAPFFLSLHSDSRCSSKPIGLNRIMVAPLARS